MELVTNRLILREFEADDFLSVHAYASEVDNVKYMI
ncbi:MAG TPA: GNAT family N-acetyltransferase, partial [Firmicutes bacterium]|nr:GNAT family N-acetyltransferase [Bacillota bacterium]